MNKPYELAFGIPDNFIVDTAFAGDTVEILREFYSKDYFVYKLKTKKGLTGYSILPDHFKKINP